ncbi:GPCR kinase [Trema orientale]|uniref:non-specific serine/threonine protein kinase n=1 Tax=Trema orientale TaxID=63057 RepID=A0A2P5EUU8_TREOI|nr:GPCR kinase [Trema orientale]
MVAMFVLLLGNIVLASGHHHHAHSLATDKAALLAFKNAIIQDPYSTLSNWNDSVHVCYFNGVSCDKQHHRVSQLILMESRLVGSLSPFISNLTGLRILCIVNNHLLGAIPQELSSLRRLHYLRLDGNNLHGPIPDSFSLPPNLKVSFLFDNNLNGTLSPAFFYNCSSSLESLDISTNSLSGKVPVEIGKCKNLRSLNIGGNQFAGELPFSLANTSLWHFDVEYNRFAGELPSKIFGNLRDLRYLYLSYNKLESHDGNTDLSPFFAALENCSHLEELELAGMGLGGRLPNSIGRLGVNFAYLSLGENQITGSIPPSISNLSTLYMLNLTSNLLNGTIHADISHLPILEQLYLSRNLFTGPIQEALGQLTHLGILDLSHNKFCGEIPASFGNLSRLNYLFLNNNLLFGKIPPTLGNCEELHKIDLSHNRLTGKIPSEILLGMREIRIYMNFSHNHLEGPLPIELSKLEDVQEIDLSSNNLSGNIFPQISSCIALRLINLSHNALQGKLPDSIGDLKNLEILDVSGNYLSKIVPKSLNKSRTLTYLNISFNDFRRMIPSGGVFLKHKRYLFHSRVFLSIFIILLFLLALLLLACCVICRRSVLISSANSTAVIEPTSPEFIHNFPRITYRELFDATSGFDEQRLIGSGSYGRVYKGVLSNGTNIAVKVLHFQSPSSTKSFHRECQVFKIIRHRNLARIITVCCFPDFKALVFPYMANGSLDRCLHEHSSNSLSAYSSGLTLTQRVNICSDIAEGIAYLHHHAPAIIIHCDLKPSNVLLNSDMTALVSDFGIARFAATETNNAVDESLELRNSASDMLVGSIGYIPPEYGFSSKTTTKGDVYSFGILVQEMVTGKRPTDDMFVGGLTLQNWVKSNRHGRIEEVVDSSLVRASRNVSIKVKKTREVVVGALIELSILCTQESPSSRPTMLDVAVDLNRLKRYLSGCTKL